MKLAKIKKDLKRIIPYRKRKRRYVEEATTAVYADKSLKSYTDSAERDVLSYIINHRD